MTAILIACAIGIPALTFAIRVIDHHARPEISIPPGLEPLRDWVQ